MDNIKQIHMELQRKRDRAERERNERVKEIYNIIPRIKEIDETINKLGLECTKSLLKIENPSYEEYIQALKEEIDALKEEKIRLLQKYQYSIEDFEIQHDCKICGDTGYVNGRKCSCLKQRLIDLAYQQSNLGNILERENFKTFDINLFSDKKFGRFNRSPRENMQEIVSICEGFVHNFEKDAAKNLLFSGSTGLGKTFLCNCIAKELLDKGRTVIYLTAFSLFRILEQYRFNQSETSLSNRQLDAILTCDLLIIDDLGTELSNSFTLSELFNIINTRLLENKKMIISTNLNSEQLIETYGQRIFSRISSHFEALEFYGNDLRCKKAPPASR